jgi:hypothetical protein
MTRILFATAFLLGAAAVGWIGLDFAGSHALAFIITAVIGGVYLIGIFELVQFRRATGTLENALGTIPPVTENPDEWLEHWLNRLDPSLRNAVRLRIEGERVGLPAPVFTPYLVGLLVMLGLLGTFVGMVDTLSGAVLALQGSTELEAIRAGLAAPIQGLGVAFGTSVAGVAASAMLGLMSTLVRRDRMLATRRLEGTIAAEFRGFSLAHQRQQAYNALQSQAQALPAVADKLQGLATQLELMGSRLGDSLLANQERFHETTEQRYSQLGLMGDRLGESLLANQERFQETTRERYTELADSVDRSLRESLAASGQAAGDSIKPVVAEAMADISVLAQDAQKQLASTAREQLQSFGEEFRTASTALLESFQATSSAWASQTRALQDDIKQSITNSTREISDTTRASATSTLDEIRGLLQSTESLVQARMASEQAWLDTQGERLERLTVALTAELGKLASQEEQGHAAAVNRLAELESTVAAHLVQLGEGLEAPMTRLIETASETPRAAAEVIGLLRAEITNNVERDNQLLAERQRVMEELNALSGSLEQAATGQREAVEKLVDSSAGLLQDISTRFGEHILAEVTKMSEASANVAGGATELSSLGEAFSLAVELFSSSNETLVEHLARLEESMERSSARSDEQMAYYVAQAREIIDQSMLSQKEIMEDLQRLSRKKSALAAEAL